MGRITRFAYDRLSRLIAVVLPNPATGANPPLVDGNSPEPGALVTRYAYDEQGNKISQTDAEGRITRWTFDGMGRQRSRVLPMGQQEQFEYDAGGQPSAHLTFNGERIETTHDSLGRIATLTLPGGHVRRFTYSASGQVAQIDDNGAVYGFEYDARDRLSRAVDPQGRAIDYRYQSPGSDLVLQYQVPSYELSGCGSRGQVFLREAGVRSFFVASRRRRAARQRRAERHTRTAEPGRQSPGSGLSS
jgi:YD repeat-containing protein